MNNLEFIEQIKDEEMRENVILVSFDVVSLFPSVSIEHTLDLLDDWLEEIKFDIIQRRVLDNRTIFNLVISFTCNRKALRWDLHLYHLFCQIY